MMPTDWEAEIPKDSRILMDKYAIDTTLIRKMESCAGRRVQI